MDLHDGHDFAHVEERHRSVEFIALLNDLDTHHPAARTIPPRDGQPLATRPNRFKYVLTPAHGSWLNLAETLFRKDGAHVSPGIRVNPLEELRQRILKGIDEINQAPVVHR